MAEAKLFEGSAFVGHNPNTLSSVWCGLSRLLAAVTIALSTVCEDVQLKLPCEPWGGCHPLCGMQWGLPDEQGLYMVDKPETILQSESGVYRMGWLADCGVGHAALGCKTCN